MKQTLFALICSGWLSANCVEALAAPVVSDVPQSAVSFSPAVASLPRLSSLTIALPGGISSSFSLNVDTPEPGMFGIRGNSVAGDRLYLFVAGDAIQAGDIFGSKGSYKLIENEGRYFWAASRDTPQLNQPIVPANAEAADLATPKTFIPAARVSTNAGKDLAGNYLIDLLVLYTPAHETSVGAERAYVQSLVFGANSYMELSMVPVRFRVAKLSRYNGTNESVGFYENLDALAVDRSVRSSRDASQADVVVLLRALGGTNPEGISGLAVPFNNAEQSDPPTNVNPERDAFAIIASESSRHVFAHELGHILGGGHLFAQGAATYWKSYAHATLCKGIDGDEAYTSLMNGVNVATGDTSSVGDFVSNPALLLNGRPCGQDGVTGTEATEANNARAMAEAAPYVAAYRGPKAAPTSERAFSGAFELAGLGTLLVMSFLGPRRASQKR